MTSRGQDSTDTTQSRDLAVGPRTSCTAKARCPPAPLVRGIGAYTRGRVREALGFEMGRTGRKILHCDHDSSHARSCPPMTDSIRLRPACPGSWPQPPPLPRPVICDATCAMTGVRRNGAPPPPNRPPTLLPPLPPSPADSQRKQ